MLQRAAALGSWAGAGERAVTAKGVLRRQDVPAAAAVIGVKCPPALRSAADLPDLHIAWCAAIGAGLLTVAGGKAAGGVWEAAERRIVIRRSAKRACEPLRHAAA